MGGQCIRVPAWVGLLMRICMCGNGVLGEQCECSRCCLGAGWTGACVDEFGPVGEGQAYLLAARSVPDPCVKRR